MIPPWAATGPQPQPRPPDLDTPVPVYERVLQAPITDMPEPMAFPEKQRTRAAAFRATKAYPGPVGELIARELMSWDEFGYRLGSHALVSRLVDHVLEVAPPDQSGGSPVRPFSRR